MASLSELIKEIGDENVTVQALHTCMDSALFDKGLTTITFNTEGLGATDLVDHKKTALIVWVDSDQFNNALIKCRGGDE